MASSSPTDSVPGDAVIPLRDPEARARLYEVARVGAPLLLAKDRLLPVPGPLGALVPELRRGMVVAVTGVPGGGATTLAFGLVAAASAAGEWAGALCPDHTLGALAASAAGVDLTRFAVVRDVPLDRWAVVAAALLDAITVVLVEVPRGVRAADARRLVSRARERGAVLVTLGEWPAAAALRIHAEGGEWNGFRMGDGILTSRNLSVRVEGSGAPLHGLVSLAS